MSLYISTRSKQPAREPWSRERLIQARALALSNSLDSSTRGTYTSHLQSYLTFCKMHSFTVDPTPDTLSFYIVYMAHHISPKSLPSYLSGIINSIEHLFPEARANRLSAVVKRTLQGCMKIHPRETKRKRALMYTDLERVVNSLASASSYDDILFASVLLTGFYGLMRLGELVNPDSIANRSFRKIIKRHTTSVSDDHYKFLLPAHKADRLFEGNVVIIPTTKDTPDALTIFRQYLRLRDAAFPHHIPLFLRSNGEVPVRSWFITRLKTFFPDNVAGHSLRSGGATALAISGIPDSRIQALGRWTSDAFQMYIRKHPALLHTLVTGRALFSGQQ